MSKKQLEKRVKKLEDIIVEYFGYERGFNLNSFLIPMWHDPERVDGKFQKLIKVLGMEYFEEESKEVKGYRKIKKSNKK